ncbi:4351_t:CDS:2 [Funneliformis geosporum]|uniref:4351_t:CDS:1 n=1 Tax=Funneliformis geosporum TaxID=1117311 RepID=A0A9W4SD51_9GLOM|nr:4351_t:CDS:2 [Funneliformis geosporum]
MPFTRINYNWCTTFDRPSKIQRNCDLGLCQPVKSLNKGVHGVLPFVAPEVLKGKPYTQASDIYSFSMILWEFVSGITPFNDRAHDLQLCLSIVKGERPPIVENTPQPYIDLLKRCWDGDPLKRPTALEISDIISACSTSSN